MDRLSFLIRPKKIPEIPITETKKLGSVGNDKLGKRIYFGNIFYQHFIDPALKNFFLNIKR